MDPNVPADERYEIVGRIAAGGMAEIYLARMASNAGPREVVLKRLLPELQADQEFVQMFHDEARIASHMSHPNVVQIYELGELDGSLFISMELLRGVNLRDLLARIHAVNMRLPNELALRICADCLGALHYAHAFTSAEGEPMNVVHRDVSPQNILVTFDGTVKLVDFGVAKAEGRLHQTRAGLVKGKFAYMSPEQVTGGAVDGRSDIFALAEVFYEMMLERHPFYAASDMDVLRAILDSEPPAPRSLDPEFPQEVADIFMKAMAKEPDARYPTAGAMKEALEDYLRRARTPATPIAVGRFVRDAFSDRVALEEKARKTGDDDLLIEAMTAGHVEKVDLEESGMRKPPEPKAAVPQVSAPSDDAPVDATIGRSALRQEVHGLFGEGEEDPNARPPVDGPSMGDEDATEMPTILGDFTPEELAEVRQAAERVRVRDWDAPASNEVAVSPASNPSGPSITRSSHPVADQPVTTRSETVVPPDEAAHPKKSLSDRIGLVFFIAGLGALIGATIYAWQVLSGPDELTIKLSIKSTPPGAAILIDGTDIGAVTPQLLPSIPSDKPHVIQLRLKGFLPYEQKLNPLPHAKEHEISATLAPEPKAGSE